MKYLYKYILLTLLLFLSAELYLSTNSFNFGYKFYLVSSESMSPYLQTGDLIMSKMTNDFKAGDIVTFRSPTDYQNYITHRIVRENFDEEQTFTTKGDNNNTEDPWQLTEDMVVGKLVGSLPKVGYPLLLLKSSNIYLAVLGLVLLTFCIIEINFLSREVLKEWKILSNNRRYIRIRKFLNRIDEFMGKYLSKVGNK